MLRRDPVVTAPAKSFEDWADHTRAFQVAPDAKIDLRYCGKSSPEDSGCNHTAFVRVPPDFEFEGKLHPRAGLWTHSRMHISQAKELCIKNKLTSHEHIDKACAEMKHAPVPETQMMTGPPGDWPIPPPPNPNQMRGAPEVVARVQSFLTPTPKER